MKLDKPKFKFKPRKDRRPRMEEPPPVALEAVEHVHLRQPAVAREELVRLYVDILEFVEIEAADAMTFRASNFAVHFDNERKEDHDYRPVRVTVSSLAATEARLLEQEILYERQKGLMPGVETLVLKDADGNWIEIRERRELG